MENTKIFISIIIPMYNAETTIIKVLESVLNQTYNNYEIIIINDGSKDRSVLLVKKFLENKNVQWTLIDETNHGVSYARNIGIKNAKGKYTAFLDADDEWDAKKLEYQVEFLEKTHAKIVGTNKEKTKEIVPVKEYKLQDMLFKNYVYTSSVLVEKEILINKGLFNEDKSYSEDYELWLKIACDTPIYIIQKKLVSYGEIDQKKKGLSSKLWRMELGELDNYQMLLKNKKISVKLYIFACALSFIKYLKRCILNFWS